MHRVVECLKILFNSVKSWYHSHNSICSRAVPGQCNVNATYVQLWFKETYKISTCKRNVYIEKCIATSLGSTTSRLSDCWLGLQFILFNFKAINPVINILWIFNSINIRSNFESCFNDNIFLLKWVLDNFDYVPTLKKCTQIQWHFGSKAHLSVKQVPSLILTVVVYHVQHLAPSNSVCRGALLVFPGSNVYRGTFIVFPYSNFSWGTLLVFPDTNICSKILLHTILWRNDQKFGKTPNFFKSLKRSGSGKV